MTEISSATLMTAAIIAIVLLFLSSMASVVTAVLMMGFNNWLKVSINEVRRLSDKVDLMEHRVGGLEARSSKNKALIMNLYHMMMDASNTELSGEEIARKIRTRIKSSGISRAKSPCDEDIVL